VWCVRPEGHLAFVGRGSKVRTCSVLQLSALLIFREVASSNSQEQEPDNDYQHNENSLRRHTCSPIAGRLATISEVDLNQAFIRGPILLN
jgi:hypothetical protein